MSELSLNRFKIGSRTLKTGIAVSLSIAIANALNAEPAVFAAVSAVVNLQPTVYQSYINALQQIGITMIGIVIGIMLSLTFGNSALMVGVSSVILIMIALKLRWNSVILVGIVTIVFVVDAQNDIFLEHAFARISVIFIGLIVALLVNIILAPADYRKFTLEKLFEFHTDVTMLFHKKITDFISKAEPTKQDADYLINLINQSEKLSDKIDIYKNEVRVLPFSSQAKELQINAQLVEDLYRYDVQLLNKLQLIKDIKRERYTRLASRITSPYTQSFQVVIDYLHQTNEDILENSLTLMNKLFKLENSSTYADHQWKTVSITDEFYDELNAWYNEYGNSSNSMEALVEISIVIYEIRWIAREQQRLYNKYITKVV
jgi:uncharacterized membrane protein YgaE (UPF0421/DUF939 family)